MVCFFWNVVVCEMAKNYWQLISSSSYSDSVRNDVITVHIQLQVGHMQTSLGFRVGRANSKYKSGLFIFNYDRHIGVVARSKYPIMVPEPIWYLCKARYVKKSAWCAVR